MQPYLVQPGRGPNATISHGPSMEHTGDNHPRSITHQSSMEQAAAAVSSLTVSDRNAYLLQPARTENMQSSSSLLKSYIDTEHIA